MPNPTISDVHVDRALNDISVRWTQSRSAFIADTVFPIVRVPNRSDKFWTFDRSYFFRTDAKLRAPGTESAGSGWEMSTDSYFCDVYAIHKDIDDQTLANADSAVNLDRNSVEFVTQHLLQRREQAWVNTFFTTSVWATDVTPANKWDDYAAGDPIGDLRTGLIAVQENTALRPNTLVLGAHVWNKIQDHPDFLDRIKYTERGIMGTELLASMLRIDRVVISDAVKNTANEAETPNYEFIFGKHALLLYVPDNPGREVPASGYTFIWSGLMGTAENGMRIKRFRMEQIASERIEAEEALDQKLVSSELGYFFNAAVA